MYSLVIVDDDINLINGIKRHVDLNSIGVSLTGCAYNGSDGTKLIREKKPDIVLSDISMPDMTGIEMIEQLQKDSIKPLCILLTGLSDFEHAKKAISIGVIEYVVKPAFPDDIISALQKATKLLDKEKKSIVPDSAPDTSENPSFFDGIVYKMKQYANQNYGKEVSIDELSELLSLSPNYLRTIFKNTTGISFKKYITELRMNKAQELLSTTSLKVYEVAEQVGFKDIKHFREVFVKHHGVTPKQKKRK